MPTPTKRKRKSRAQQYRCQFCERDSTARQWKKLNDRCPKCGLLYNAILAQEGDD